MDSGPKESERNAGSVAVPRCRRCAGAFAFFGGVPQSILYDNTKLAVARILGDGTRQRTRVFSELRSHYLFADRFGRPGKSNDKGKVEGLVGLIRRNFLVPVPHAESFAALNEQLLADCRRRLGDRLRGHDATIGWPGTRRVSTTCLGRGKPATTTRRSTCTAGATPHLASACPGAEPAAQPQNTSGLLRAALASTPSRPGHGAPPGPPADCSASSPLVAP
jgi:hypothetical protein